MAKWVKALATQPDDWNMIHQDPRCGQRELIFASCSLTSTLML